MSLSYYKRELDVLTGKGILALVDNCRKLEVLELDGVRKVGRETIEQILQMLADSRAVAKAVVSDEDGTYALREISLVGYSFVVEGNPLRLVDVDLTAGDDDEFGTYLASYIRARAIRADAMALRNGR